MGTPVNHPVTAVDQTLIVKAQEHLLYRFGTPFIHGKTFSRPVAGGTHLLQLLDDPSAILFLPFPSPLQKGFPADLLFGDSLFAHRLHNLGLGSDGSMVGARHPKGVIPLHPAPTDQDILQRIVQRMAHMQLPGDVGRWDHNGIRSFIRLYFRVKVVALEPKIINPVFHLFGVINLFQFFSHLVRFLSRLIFGERRSMPYQRPKRKVLSSPPALWP